MSDDASFIPGLFNTQLSESISSLFTATLQSQKKYVEPADIKYGLPYITADGKSVPVKLLKPLELPKQFDTRSKNNFPENEVKKWFYQNYKGNWMSILDRALDQAGCGSCWAFSTASQFTDVICFNLLRLYGDDACVKSIFFHPAIICTGETNIATGAGIVNKESANIYGIEDYFGISEYFTVAFAPKIKLAEGKTTLDLKCNDVIEEWKQAISTVGRAPERVEKILASNYLSCLGCQGNIIACPLMLFTGAVEESVGTPEGAPLITDFPLHEWACLWGSLMLRQRFCSPEFLAGEISFEFPKLYKADYYSYVAAKNGIPDSIKAQGITNMTEWMMMSIYYYGPITIGYSVYQSFLNFFKKKANATKIYTADQFIEDYENGGNSVALGGHAVVIVGWGEESKAESSTESKAVISPSSIKYWVVRNSWGTKWADQGFFRIERDIDFKLEMKGISQRIKFEQEFGALYFAPYPNEELGRDNEGNIIINKMKDYIMPYPSFRCPAFGEHKDLVDQMTKHCSCRCAFYYDFTNNQCKHGENVSYPAGTAGLQYTANVADFEEKKCKFPGSTESKSSESKSSEKKGKTAGAYYDNNDNNKSGDNNGSSKNKSGDNNNDNDNNDNDDGSNDNNANSNNNKNGNNNNNDNNGYDSKTKSKLLTNKYGINNNNNNNNGNNDRINNDDNDDNGNDDKSNNDNGNNEKTNDDNDNNDKSNNAIKNKNDRNNRNNMTMIIILLLLLFAAVIFLILRFKPQDIKIQASRYQTRKTFKN